MNRLLVALLAAFDAVIVVAVGVVAALAPLTVLWVVGIDDADWGALWPAAARIWQVGHFVPLHVTLGDEYAAIAGIPADATSFVFSLAPLAFALFTAVFAARSGARAARAGAWVVGVCAGAGAVAALSAGIALTSAIAAVDVDLWQAVLLPTLVFGVAALGGALVRAWRDGDDGPLDRLRDLLDLDDTGIVQAGARGLAAAVVGLLGVGAALTAVGLALSGGEIVALFEAAHVDLVGAIVIGLGQLAYLPTLVVWGSAYAAGPGFALGAGTTVSPGGTSLGVVPGIPLLGIVPESPSPWLLLLALAVVAVGAFAGWTARVRLQEETGEDEPLVPRLAALGVIVVGSAVGAAVLALAASGALGPGRLQQAGPEAGPLALVVGVEVALGAAAVLLAPRARTQTWQPSADADDTAPIEPLPEWADHVEEPGDESAADATPGEVPRPPVD